MITEKSITSEWINLVSKQHRDADRILVEKVIRSMRLLEGMSESGLKFIFKGGTSLMLLLKSTRRLSIDIDIIIPEKLSFIGIRPTNYIISMVLNSV